MSTCLKYDGNPSLALQSKMRLPQSMLLESSRCMRLAETDLHRYLLTIGFKAAKEFSRWRDLQKMTRSAEIERAKVDRMEASVDL